MLEANASELTAWLSQTKDKLDNLVPTGEDDTQSVDKLRSKVEHVLVRAVMAWFFFSI